MRSWLALLLLLLPGCASPPGEPAVAAAGAAPPLDLWGTSTEQVLLEYTSGTMVTASPLCKVHPDRLGRGDGRVLPGAASVEVTLEVPDASTGVQVGFRLGAEDRGDGDGPGAGEITWLEPVRSGSETFSLPVPPEGYEEPQGSPRWHFYRRLYPPAERCAVGLMAGTHSVLAVAVKG